MKRVPGLDYDVLDDLLGYTLRRAQLAMFASFDEATRGKHLTPPRFTALVVIGANPGLSQTVLGRVLGIARSGAIPLGTERSRAGCGTGVRKAPRRGEWICGSA